MNYTKQKLIGENKKMIDMLEKIQQQPFTSGNKQVSAESAEDFSSREMPSIPAVIAKAIKETATDASLTSPLQRAERQLELTHALKIQEEKWKKKQKLEKHLETARRMQKRGGVMEIIQERENTGQKLSIAELCWLYDLDLRWKIDKSDEDIDTSEEIIIIRDIKEDLAVIFDCPEENISMDKEDIAEKQIEYFYGHLDISNLVSNNGIIFPKSVSGDLNIRSLTQFNNLILPEYVGGNLYLPHVKSFRGIRFPEYVGGDLNITWLEEANGVKFPEQINGNFSLPVLTSLRGIELPKIVNGYLKFNQVVSLDGIKFPEYVGDDIYLHGLTSIKGLRFPDYVGGEIYFKKLSDNEVEELKQKYPNHEIRKIK